MQPINRFIRGLGPHLSRLQSQKTQVNVEQGEQGNGFVSAQDRINQANRNIATNKRKIAVAEDELARLRIELQGLQGAQRDVLSNRQSFLQQLSRKRSKVKEAGNISGARAAIGYADMMTAALGPSFENGVCSCFDRFSGQIAQAISDVESEIRQKQNQIDQLYATRGRLVQELCDGERQLADERRASRR